MRSCGIVRSFAAAFAVGSIDEVGLSQLLSVVSSTASLPATLMLLWLILPRSEGSVKVVGVLTDFDLVRIMLLSQAAGVAFEIAIVTTAALRPAAAAAAVAIQAARSTRLTQRLPTGTNTDSQTRTPLTCISPLAAIQRATIVWLAIVGRIAACRLFTWTNGAVSYMDGSDSTIS